MWALAKRLFWRGGVADRVAAITTGVVAVIALVVSVLSAVNIVDLDGEMVQSFGLFGIAAVLFWLLSEGTRRADQDTTHQDLIGEVRHLLGAVASSLPEVRQISSDEIAGELDRQLKQSRSWSFRGGSGRWLRQASLPAMARIRDQVPIVHLQLLDPRSKHLCERYAQYRARQRSPEDVRPDESDPRTIQTDILASIAALYWHAAVSRIEPRAVLLGVFSPLRFDVGDETLAVTVADRTAPGLLARRDTWFYSSIVDEIGEAHRVGNRVLESTPPSGDRPDAPTAEWVRLVLGGLTVTAPESGPTPLLDGFADEGSLNFSRIAERVLGSRD